MKSAALKFVCVLSLVIVPLGCGDDTSDSSSASSSSTSSPSSASPAAPTTSGSPSTAASTPPSGQPMGGAPGGEHGAPGGGYDGGNADAGEHGAGGPDYSGAPDYGAGGPASQKPKHPANASDWTITDIAAGIAESDRQTLQAIAAYSEKMKGKPEAITQIMTWLKDFEAAATKPQQGGYGSEYGSDYGGAPPASEYGTDMPEGTAPPCGALLTPHSFPRSRPTENLESPSRLANLLASSLVSFQAPNYPGGDPAAMPMPDGYGSAPGYPGSGQGGAQRASQDQIGKALIEALLDNGTIEGYAQVREILKGSVLKASADQKSLNDRKVVDWTIAALMAHIDGPNSPAKKILEQTLFEPEVFRPVSTDRNHYSADELRRRSLQLHAAYAKAAMEGFMGIRNGQRNQRQNNNGGYGGAPGYPGGDPAQSAVEGYSGAPAYPGAVEGYPGAPDQGNPPAQPAGEKLPDLKLPNASLTPEQGAGAVYYFWDETGVQAYASSNLRNIARLGQNPEVFVLAGAIPSKPIRDQFQQFLAAHWEQNPSYLLQQGIFSKYWCDPGLLVTLKSLPREQPAQTQGGAGEYGDPGAGQGQPRRSSRNRSKDTPAQQAAKEGWYKASEQFLLSVMDRMAAAGQGDRPTEHDPDELKVRLHRDAQITTQYRLQFPPPGSDLSLYGYLAPTTVNYVRLEFVPQSERDGQQIKRHYTGQVTGEEERTILGNKALWLDGALRKNRIDGTISSYDIVLSSGGSRPLVSQQGRGGQNGGPPGAPYGAGAEGGGGQGQMVAVEILAITVPDPDYVPAEKPSTTGSE